MTSNTAPPNCYSCNQPVLPGDGFNLMPQSLIKASSEHKRAAISDRWHSRPTLGEVHAHIDCIDDPTSLDPTQTDSPFRAWALARINQIQLQINRLKAIVGSPPPQ